MTRTTAGSAVTTYTWDAADRLIGTALPNGTTTANQYDSDGRRVKTTKNGITTNYLWDELSAYGDVVLESDASGNALASYVLGGSELLRQNRAGVFSYYLADGQGSTRKLTDSFGAVSDSYVYDAFGTRRSAPSATINKYLYTGQQYDAATDLYSLRARYYSPGIGRFISRDTWGLDTGNPVELNRYVYVANRAINAIDPTGKFSFFDFKARITNIITVTIGVLKAFGQAVYERFVRIYIQIDIRLGELFRKLVGTRAQEEAATGTIWDKISQVGPNRPGNSVPESFNLTVQGKDWIVNSNATKHMQEYLLRNGSSFNPISSQAILSSLEASVEAAMQQGITWRQMMVVGGWELKFDAVQNNGTLPVIYHAIFRG